MRSAIVLSLLLAGCSTSSSQYYDAIRKAAEAQERTHAARYAALADIASKSGSTEATAAATMAIALSQPQTIQPQYVESGALRWLQALMPSAVALGGMWLQADTARTIAADNRALGVIQAEANRDIQLGQQGVLQSLGQTPVQITDILSQGQGGIVDTVVGCPSSRSGYRRRYWARWAS